MWLLVGGNGYWQEGMINEERRGNWQEGMFTSIKKGLLARESGYRQEGLLTIVRDNSDGQRQSGL